MRIRKNGAFPVETFQAHVCHLNQSPWDIIHQVLILFSDLLGFFSYHSLGFFIFFLSL